MARMKSGGEEDGEPQKMREITVDFDFTPNALSSILYKQGKTMVLSLLQRTKAFPDQFQETQPEDGYMLSTLLRVQRIHVSEGAQ